VSLYDGAPGPILLFLELHRRRDAPASPDLDLARRGADDLIHRIETDAAEIDCGLYTGLAGIGFVLLEVADACGDQSDAPAYRSAARGVFARIIDRAARTDAGVRWDPVTDVISGSAGIILALLDAAARLERVDPEFARTLRSCARDAGLDLLARGEHMETPEGPAMRWPMNATLDRRYPNFSHGTAGVGFALLRLDETLQAEQADLALRFRDAAIAAAHRLDDLARRDAADGLIRHHEPGGERLFYLGWCHGPPGTSRFYTLLAERTGDAAWLERVDRATAMLAAEGLPEARTPGYWNNVGRCCGAAGIADALRSVHRRTGDARHLDLARALTADLLARGTVETDDASGSRRTKWVHAEHRVRPEFVLAQTGLMQGAAGIGLWLLRLDAHEHGHPYLAVLPDELP
jgi:lantibiotic modifying enzyme